jgi:hypothetical protein
MGINIADRGLPTAPRYCHDATGSTADMMASHSQKRQTYTFSSLDPDARELPRVRGLRRGAGCT